MKTPESEFEIPIRSLLHLYHTLCISHSHSNTSNVCIATRNTIIW